MATRDRTWSAYESGICHYCGGRATTDDHIVPKSRLPRPQSRLPYWFRSQNIVPACSPCNNRKANFKSDCECGTCLWAWKVAVACFITTPVPETIQILRSP